MMNLLNRACIALILFSVIFGTTVAAQDFESVSRIAELIESLEQDFEARNSIYDLMVELHGLHEKSETDVDELEATLKTELEKNFDDFRQHCGDIGEPKGEPYQDKLARCRDAFIEEYVSFLMCNVRGEEVPEMEAAVFLETCNELGLHLNLDYSITIGRSNPDYQQVVLSLPKMDCGGCEKRVTEKLSELEGIWNIETNVTVAGCQFFVPTSINVREKLDEFAKTTTQFEGWKVRRRPLKKPTP